MKIINVANVPRKSIIAIGMASLLPPIPTSGATKPPENIEEKPKIADAVPASFAWYLIDREKLAAPKTGMVETKMSRLKVVKTIDT